MIGRVPMDDGRKRIVIENIQPRVDDGRYPIKRIVRELVSVSADIFADGHDVLVAVVLVKGPQHAQWIEIPMEARGNDRWEGKFTVDSVGEYSYMVSAWVDEFGTWQRDLEKRHQAGQDLSVHFLIGAGIVERVSQRAPVGQKHKLLEFADRLRSRESGIDNPVLVVDHDLAQMIRHLPDRSLAVVYEQPFAVTVERTKALFSTWYERFPRSCSSNKGMHGTLSDCVRVLPEIARMGFDVWYLPPIHPIGKVNRKGKNNTPAAAADDVGSPWAIGSDEGGISQSTHFWAPWKISRNCYRQQKTTESRLRLTLLFNAHRIILMSKSTQSGSAGDRMARCSTRRILRRGMKMFFR